ncbi:MAG: hypothetical protein H6729_11850 [Deltaproteobacteria bacterium]|nr:hypothetical protein [Deltaproteobacteria bacterium]
MGAKLEKFFKEAEAMGQLKARMRLAILTAIPSTKASAEPDSPENIKKFTSAMLELKKEFGGR